MSDSKSVQNLNLYKNPKGFRGRSAITVQLWWIVQSTLFGLSPQFLYGWRRFLLRSFGAKIGKKVIVRPTARITFPWKLTIGDYSWIGDDVVLYSLGEIEVGKNSVISQRSYLCTGSHDYTVKEFPIYAEKITIGDQCWLATDVFISPGITISDGAVIGARSTVIKDINKNTVNVGSPTVELKER